MYSVQQHNGAWSRQLWLAVAVLTTLGVVGTGVLFFALFGNGIHAGCGGFGGVLLALALALLLVIGLIGALALAGAALFWFRSRWGPLLLVLSNAMAMGLFGWIVPVAAPLVWVVLVLGAAPAIAMGLLVWPLLTRGRTWVKAIEFVVLGLFALPFVWLYAFGLPQDIKSASAGPPAPVVASTSCSGG